MSTETISPAKASSIRTLQDPQASASRPSLRLPESRPRQDSVTSNKASSVKSVYSRPASRAGTLPDSGDEYDIDGPQAPPIPGFVVAGSKRNADFHELFPNVPEMDYLIQDYGCAWHRDILIQGRLYISENHLCFYANIFGWITTLTIPFLDVLGLDKRMTAYVIPNAILVTTHSTEYTFASFLARDTVYEVMQSLWHPVPKPAAAQLEEDGDKADGEDDTESVSGEDAADQGGTSGHEPTECACGKGGEHYPTPVIDAVFPGTPEKIYDLMSKSQFMSDFLSVNQKLTEITNSEWTPKEPDSPLLCRDMSYIKPLSGGLGPKQTKCEIKEEVAHLDFDDYISTLATTRTPDVPSGGLFSVKTRSCLMWAGAASTRLVVTSTMEWTGRSFIRGVIDRSAIEGQKQYHQELEKAMRKYISAHKRDFVPKGLTVATSTASDLGDVSGASDSGERTPSEAPAPKSNPTTSTLTTISQAVYDISQTVFDQLKEIPTTNALGVLVVVLALSNLWSLLGPRAEPRLPGEVSLKARSGTIDGAVQPSYENPRRSAKRQKEVAETRKEIRELRRSMEAIEKRLAKLDSSLSLMDLD